MINRDFSSSGKQYIKQNKFVLIALAVVVVMAIIMICTLGFNAGADVKGYRTFSINLSSVDKVDMSNYEKDISLALSSNDASLYSVQLAGEGEQSILIVKYMGEIKDEAKTNAEIANVLQINVEEISTHSKVSPSILAKDYIFTIACGLIIIALAVIFIAIRYNLACAITALVSSLLSVILLISLTAIFRLTVTSSFLAINIITILLVLCEGFILFDGLERTRDSLEDKNDRSTQLSKTLASEGFRQKFMYGAIFAIALILVFIAPSAIKRISLVALFAIVVAMFVTVYALPFLWSLTITQVSDKIRTKKDKKTKKAIENSATGELNNNYKEDQVIEVKEDNDLEESPSQDDNITID